MGNSTSTSGNASTETNAMNVEETTTEMNVEETTTEEVVESTESVTESTPDGPSNSALTGSIRKPRRKIKKRANPALYSGIRGGRGNVGSDFYDNLTLEIQQAATEFDTNEPEKILDLCLIMDCTGSMSSWMAHCKDTLKDVIDDTIQKDPDCKVRVAFVCFRDFCDAEIFAIHDFSYNADSVKAFMNQQSAKGGGDTPEDVQGGLRKALDLNWSPLEDSIKLAFLCADAPCHGSRYHDCSDDYPEGNPCGLELEALVREFSDREILLTCYKITDQTEKMYGMIPGAYNQGAQQDGVEFIDIRGQVKSANSRGVSLHSAEVRDHYTREFNTSKSVQISKHRCRKRGW